MNHYFPIAIRMGIPYQEFMNMIPKVFHKYHEEYRKKKQEEVDMINYSAWLNGLYISHAIGASFSKNGKYLNKPLGFSSEDEIQENDAIQFGAWASAFNKTVKVGEDN